MLIYDVVIVGAGLVGASIARELSRYQLKIAVLEKEEEFSFGVSKSNSGIIHPGTQNSKNSLKGKLCVKGNSMMRKVSKELGVDFKEVVELIVIFDEKDMPRLLAMKKDASELGVKRLKIVNGTWLRKNEPNLSHDAVAALYAPTAGIISPYRLVYALAENAVANGVEIYTNHRVVSIARNKTQQLFEVATPETTFGARYVVNAAGLYADEISRMLGIDYFQIKPRKGEEFILDKKKEYLTRHLLFPMPVPNSKGVLVIKTADGNPMIGPTAEEVIDKEDLSTTDEGLKKILASTQRMIPSIDQKDIIAYFAGLRPAAGDDFIIRAEEKAPGFINVAGIQSPGLTAAPAIAVMVGQILRSCGLVLKNKRMFLRHRHKSIHLFSTPLDQVKKLIKKDSSYGDIVCRCEMVSAKEVNDAIARGAKTLDGIKFRTRAQAGRCHGSFCTTRLLKILNNSLNKPLTKITKKGPGSEIVLKERGYD